MPAHAAGAKRVANVEASPGRRRDWSAHRRGQLSDAPPPADLDLRTRRPWYRAVRDQGETGSCVGWALADSVLRFQLVEAGRLKPSQRLSPRFIWMASKELRAQRLTDDAWRPSTFLEEAPTSLKDGLDVARRFGVVTEPVLRWQGPLNRGAPERFYEHAARFKLTAYYTLDDDDPVTTFARWRRWLAQHGPVLLLVGLDRAFIRGDPHLARYEPRRRPEGHACALVGYTEAGFIIRNSWGRDWGSDGYATAAPEWLRRAWSESYGLVV
jgi:hypothetical protein